MLHVEKSLSKVLAPACCTTALHDLVPLWGPDCTKYFYLIRVRDGVIITSLFQVKSFRCREKVRYFVSTTDEGKEPTACGVAFRIQGM